MKVHKVTLMIVDFDKLGAGSIKEVIENQQYPNRCIYPNVMEVKTKDIGPWDDSHPLNQIDQMQAAFEELFHE
jgi:hypothetical protein